MSTVFLVLYWIGFPIAWWQAYHRVGFGRIKSEQHIDWREFLLANIPWFALTVLKVWFWFVTLAVWLATGRGDTRWIAITEVNSRPIRRIVRV